LSADQLNVNEDQALSIRAEVTQKAIQEKLSLSQIKSLVKDTLKQYRNSEISINNKVIEKTVNMIRAINSREIQRSQLVEIRQALLEKL